MDESKVKYYDLVPKDLELNPAGLQPRNCFVCHTRDNISRCAACKVTYYCGPAHQAADRKRHKLACTHITRTREAYEVAERDWKESTEPVQYEDQAILVFPDHEAEEAYLVALDRYSKTLQLEHTVDAVQHSLAERFEILNIDHRGVYESREYMPLGLLRLGRDQDAYDVAKWWTLRDDGHDPRYKRQHRYQEDVFESPFAIMRSKNALFGTLDGLLLLKIKLYLDLRDICNADRMLRKVVVRNKGTGKGTGAAARTLPSEVIDTIKGYNIRSHVVRERRELVENHGFVASPLVCGLKRQIRELARAVYDNPEYTGDEMEVKYMYARPSWVEMPEAAQVLDDAQEGIAVMAETNPYWARRVPLDDDDDDNDDDDYDDDDYDDDDYDDDDYDDDGSD